MENTTYTMADEAREVRFQIVRLRRIVTSPRYAISERRRTLTELLELEQRYAALMGKEA